MVDTWVEQIIFAKYHLRVSERLLNFYSESPEKRFFIGGLNELSRAAANIIKGVLIQANNQGKIKIVKNSEKNLNNFKKIARNYLNNHEIILEIMKIKSDHKKSPVQYDRGGEILFLIDGRYKVLTFKKLRDLSKKLMKETSELKIV